jgi:hypothetical protein
MRSIYKAGMLIAMLAAVPVASHAATMEGIDVDAGTVGVIAGVVSGSDIVEYREGDGFYRHRRHHSHCWINEAGHRHCSWR